MSHNFGTFIIYPRTNIRPILEHNLYLVTYNVHNVHNICFLFFKFILEMSYMCANIEVAQFFSGSFRIGVQ